MIQCRDVHVVGIKSIETKFNTRAYLEIAIIVELYKIFRIIR